VCFVLWLLVLLLWRKGLFLETGLGEVWRVAGRYGQRPRVRMLGGRSGIEIGER